LGLDLSSAFSILPSVHALRIVLDVLWSLPHSRHWNCLLLCYPYPVQKRARHLLHGVDDAHHIPGVRPFIIFLSNPYLTRVPSLAALRRHITWILFFFFLMLTYIFLGTSNFSSKTGSVRFFFLSFRMSFLLTRLLQSSQGRWCFRHHYVFHCLLSRPRESSRRRLRLLRSSFGLDWSAPRGVQVLD
jgi:hypothetical protein